jgi:hypothetical protein
MNKRWKAIAVAIAVLALALVGCTSVNTQPDEVALHYSGGGFSSTDFKNCVGPGTKNYDGPGDHHYTYPFGQRTATFGDNAEFGKVSVVTSDAVTMDVSGVVTFALNTDCDTLREFHERIGIKYEAWTDDGWDRMLQVYIGQPLNQALDQASKNYTTKALYVSSDQVKNQWEQSVSTYFQQALQQLAGGDYFCQPNFDGQGECGSPVLTLQKPEPPQDIIDAFTARLQAVEQNAAAQAQQQVLTTEAQSLRKALVEAGLQPTAANLAAYTNWLAVKDGDIPLYVLPQGSNVTVQTQTQSQGNGQ